MSVNQFTFVGYLADPIKLKRSVAGAPLAHLNLAVVSSWIDPAGSVRERKNLFRITILGQNGEKAAKHLLKGSLVYVQGHVDNARQMKDDKMVDTLEFVADRIDHLKLPG